MSKTNVKEVRNALKVALDHLGHDERSKHLRKILWSASVLTDPNEFRQDLMADWANSLVESAEKLRDYIGPEDAGTDNPRW